MDLHIKMRTKKRVLTMYVQVNLDFENSPEEKMKGIKYLDIDF